MKLHVGQKLVVRLPGESGSTGYHWKLLSGAGRFLVQKERKFVPDHPPPPPGAPPVVGGGGKAVYVFEARHAGKSALSLGLFSPGRKRKHLFSVKLVIA